MSGVVGADPVYLNSQRNSVSNVWTHPTFQVFYTEQTESILTVQRLNQQF